MKSEPVSQIILRQGQWPEYYSAFAESSATAIAKALRDPGISAHKTAEGMAIFDEYDRVNQHVIEIWGPYPLNPANFSVGEELSATLAQISAPAQAEFFVDHRNLLLPELRERGFHCTTHHTWIMAQLPAPTHQITQFTTPPESKTAEQVEILHRAAGFNADSITANTSPDCPLFVHFDHTNVTGYAQGELDADGIGHLLFVAVAPQYRRQGIARALMSTLYRYLIAKGARHIELIQAASAISAGKTYAACHFTRVRTNISATKTIN